MPRNTSGNYVLPAGNPVVSDTLIEATWANPTLADIAAAVTDSLDRYGRGGMLAEFKVADGTVTAPGLSFVSQSNLGLYRKGAGILGVAAAGNDVALFSSTGIEAVKPVLLRDGTVGAPGLAFASDPITGLYKSTPGSLSVAVGGVESVRFIPNGMSTGAFTADTINTIGPIDATDVIYADDAMYIDQQTTTLWSGLVAQKLGVRRWMLRFADETTTDDFTILRADNTGVILTPNALTLSRSTGRATLAGLDVNGSFSTTGPGTMYSATMTAGFEFGPSCLSRSVINKIGGQAQGSIIQIGWSTPTAGGLNLKVDAVDFGLTWPIGITGNAALATLAAKASTIASGGGNGGGLTFTYQGTAASPVYVWGSQGAITDSQLYTTSSLSVANATNASNLGGWPAANYVRSNSCFLAGFISPGDVWRPYLANFDNTQAIFMVRNAGGVGGLSYPATNDMRFYNEVGTLLGNIGVAPVSDLRAKRDVSPAKRNILADIRGMEFIQFRYNEHAAWGDKETLYDIGFSGQNLQSINPQYVSQQGDEHYLAPTAYVLLPAAFKALQQLADLIEDIEVRLANLEGAMQ